MIHSLDSEKEILDLDVSILPIYPYIKEMSIREVIRFLNIHEIQAEDEVYSNGISGLNCLKNLDIIVIKQELSKIPSLNEVAEKLRTVITSIEYKAVQYRSDSKNTLKDIGRVLGLSLERVRQIILAAEGRMSNKLIEIGYPKYLLLMKSDNFGLSEEKIKMELSSENHFLINVLKKSNYALIYNKDIGYYFTKEEESVVQKIVSEINKMPDPILLKDFQMHTIRILDQSNEHYELEKIQDILLGMLKFKKQGIYISRKNFTYKVKMKLLFENYITKPLRIDEKGVKYLNSICVNVFGSPFNGGRKTIEGGIRSLKNVIIVAPLTYQCIDEKIISNSIWNEIMSYIDDYLLNSDQINIDVVYKVFEKKLYILKVKHKLHLYSIIKFLYREKYNVGKGNTLNIYSKRE